jgi:hypothetical protein
LSSADTPRRAALLRTTIATEGSRAQGGPTGSWPNRELLTIPTTQHLGLNFRPICGDGGT